MAKVYTTVFPDGTRASWRPLTWNEYGDLVRRYSKEDPDSHYTAWRFYEAAAALAVVAFIQDGVEVVADEVYAGSLFVVGQQVLRESGFIPDKELVTTQRARARARVFGDWYEEVATYIMALFRIPEEELRQWTIDRFMEYAVRAEQVIGKEFPFVDGGDAEPANDKVTYRIIDGKKVPVVTKADLTAKRKINVAEDPLVALEKRYVDVPRQPEGPEGPQLGQRRVHPLTQRINEIKARRGYK